jgi:hypothetical protein
MSQPAFQFVRQCLRTLWNSKPLFKRAKTATVLTVSAKHASTTSESRTSEPPVLDQSSVNAGGRRWDWLPLQTQYHAARKTIVLCHGTFSPLGLTAGLFGFDKLGFDSFPKLQFYYWGGIPEALRHLGCRVLITKVPRFTYP